MYSHFQLKLIAYDTTYPENQATATITVDVLRNPNAPSFPDSRYEITVDERTDLGVSVFQAQAYDADEVSCYLL